MKNEFIKLLIKEDLTKCFFLTADVGYGLFDKLQTKIENRFINVGISENNMIGMAAGISNTGYKVFTYSIASFSVIKCLEQIKLDVAYHSEDVCIISSGINYYYGNQGPTHHSIEDISLMYCIPEISIINPGTLEELEFVTKYILKKNGPFYLRLGHLHKEKINYQYNSTKNLEKIEADGYYEFQKGSRFTLITSGTIISNILEVLPEDVQLISCPFIRPLSLNKLVNSINCDKVLVIDESVEHGGLSDLVRKALWKKNKEISHLKSLSYKNEFPYFMGNEEYMRDSYGFSLNKLKSIFDEIK